MIGDAYAFIDPVFSSGVHLALYSAFAGAETVDGILREPASVRARLGTFERRIGRGLSTFSWFIYRVRTPAVRDLFMHPRNWLWAKQGVISLMSGDLFRRTPIQLPLLAFRFFYGVTCLLIRLRGAAADRLSPSVAEPEP